MARLVISGKFDKAAGLKRKEGAPEGSMVSADYEPVWSDGHTVGVEHEDVVVFPPTVASSTRNTLRFQGGGNSEPFAFRVAVKADDKGWVAGAMRVFGGFGSTPNDAVPIPAGTVAVSIIRADAGKGAVGYTLDLEV